MNGMSADPEAEVVGKNSCKKGAFIDAAPVSNAAPPLTCVNRRVNRRSSADSTAVFRRGQKSRRRR